VDVDAVVRAKRFQRREVARAMKQRLIDKAKLMGFEDAIEDMQDDDWL
jgi:predicted GNAT superfamily acetyltransferase